MMMYIHRKTLKFLQILDVVTYYANIAGYISYTATNTNQNIIYCNRTNKSQSLITYNS